MNKYIHFELVIKALIKKDSTFLILKTNDSNKKNDLEGWETPGGHMEKRENIYSCMERELKEETGLKIRQLFLYNAFVINRETGTPVVGLNYLVECIDGEVILDQDEHCQYKWATIEEIEMLTSSAGLQKEIEKYREFLKDLKTNKILIP